MCVDGEGSSTPAGKTDKKNRRAIPAAGHAMIDLVTLRHRITMARAAMVVTAYALAQTSYCDCCHGCFCPLFCQLRMRAEGRF